MITAPRYFILKQAFLVCLGLALISSCGSGDVNMNGNDLEGKKKTLREKRTALTQLKTEIAELESEIAELDPSSQEKSTRLVTVSTVGKKDFERYIDIQASVREGEAVYASSEMGGRIIHLNVKEGQAVRKGQLIAKLDMESMSKQISELEKSRELAQDLFDRQKRLWDQNIGSEVQYLQAKNNLERIDKSLETMRFQLTKANVYSPISGVVDQEMLQPGEMASPGMPIVSILKTNIVKVIADVPEAYLRAVQKGETVTIKFPALDMEQQAKISLLGRTINPANRTFAVEVNLSNPKGVLKPNLLAVMMINDFSAADVVTVPLELVQQDVSGQDYVFIVKDSPEGKIADKILVETGESYDGEIIIKSGLKGGETIIVEGARGLTKNELITIGDEKISQAN